MEKRKELILKHEHLAPYLLYDLKGYASDIKLKGDIKWHNVDFIIAEQPRALPILRPLSALTDEMAVNSGYKDANLLRLAIVSKTIPYIGMENLFKHHYDVFGLINLGLAIDIYSFKS